jgi:pimeloyl-ACP methyl ester carboxylesterase
MAIYVLVHGAWHGGWCWRSVSSELRAKGHEVWTPTMTGLGEREHLNPEAVDLQTHVTDIVKLLEFEDLHEVVLVGHSYGGMVVTGVASAVPERVRHLVYLDAFVPPAAGISTFDMLGDAGARMASVAGALVPVPEPPLGDFGVTDAEDLAWLRSRMRPHPKACFAQGVEMPVPLEQRSFARHYVLAAGAGPTLFHSVADRLRVAGGWQVSELPTGHDMMVTMPRELTHLLLSLA